MAGYEVVTCGLAHVGAASRLLAEAFRTDPAINYLLSSLTPDQREAYRERFFQSVLRASALNKASFDEIDDWKSCGILMPPDSRIESLRSILSGEPFIVAWNIGLIGCRRMMYELPQRSDACKAKCLAEGEKCYYVFFLGTETASRGKGLCSVIVRFYQDKARHEDRAIYMEASTEHAWKLYEKLGFRTVDQWVLGRGDAAFDGTAMAGGPGFKIWGMIWRPR